MSDRANAGVSPTAHYTGHVWLRNGLSHPELATVEGRALHLAVAPSHVIARVAGAPSLDGYLLARHAVLDALLEDAVSSGRVGQVVEIAAGMSPRGWRFTERHPDLVYVEADLPGMAARKRAALERIGRPESHRVVEVDALRDDGPGSLGELFGALDPAVGVAVITEGLLSYLPRGAVLGLWRRIASGLSRFPSGSYLSDLHVRRDAEGVLARAFGLGLSLFVRGRVDVHFDDDADAESALLEAGFATADVRPASEHAAGAGFRSAELAHIVDART